MLLRKVVRGLLILVDMKEAGRCISEKEAGRRILEKEAGRCTKALRTISK